MFLPLRDWRKKMALSAGPFPKKICFVFQVNNALPVFLSKVLANSIVARQALLFCVTDKTMDCAVSVSFTLKPLADY